MANTQQTWTNISDYVSRYWQRDAGTPDRAFYRTLAQEALAELAEGRVYETSWSNAALGGLTLTDATTPLPIDLIDITAVEWDGCDAPLYYQSEAWLDENEPGWREATGEPQYYTTNQHELILDAIPSNATGKLVVRGRSYLPAFSDTGGATNPLTIIPFGRQLAIAYYILANLPPEDDKQMMLNERFAVKWEKAKAQILAVGMARMYEPFRY
jgi:hypothetical protein